MKFKIDKIKSQICGFEFTKFCLRKRKLLISVLAISIGISIMSMTFAGSKSVSICGSKDDIRGITLNRNDEGEEIKVSAVNGSEKVSRTLYLKADNKNQRKVRQSIRALNLSFQMS